MLGQEWGRVVNVSSGIAAHPESMIGANAYAAGKAALEAHTVNLATELAGTGVTVNAFRPGPVDTAMQAWIRSQDRARIGAALHDPVHPLLRIRRADHPRTLRALAARSPEQRCHRADLGRIRPPLTPLWSWSVTAARLALNGAHVIVTGRDTTRGDQAVERIRSAGGKADFVAASLSGEASACELARKAVELGGGHIDILVNNAGIFPFGPTASHTEADFDGVYGVNVKVPFFLVAELAPAMAARGKGSIINVTTMVAQFGQPGMALYGSSKAALVLLTKAWAAEYGLSGVRSTPSAPARPAPHRGHGPDGRGTRPALRRHPARQTRHARRHRRRDHLPHD
jgi:NAD(P)-dependent dehydrogenase (short-subunit alcohol dehydrogenase family)